MASNLLKTFEKIERGRKKCIAKANEVNYPLPEDASLENIAQCIDAQGHVSEYYNDFIAIMSRDASFLKDGILRIPYTLEKIGPTACQQMSGLKGVIWPENLKEIGKNAFNACSGWEGVIDIPNTVETIGSNAFSGIGQSTKNITEVNIPSSVTSIGSTAFESMTGVINFDANITKIPDYCFRCGSTVTTGGAWYDEFNISEERLAQITEIGNSAFSYERKLKKLPIGPNVTKIDMYGFQYCEGVTEPVVIPNGCTLGNYSFAYSRLKGGITFEDGEKTSSFADYAFDRAHVGVDDLVLSKGINSIGTNAFGYIYKGYSPDGKTLEKVKRVIIKHEGTLTMGASTFNSANVTDAVIVHAKKITYSNTNGRQFYSMPVKAVVFWNLDDDTTLTTSAFTSSTCITSNGEGIFVPDDLVDHYKAQTGWSSFKNYIKPLTSWSGYADYKASLEVSE